MSSFSRVFCGIGGVGLAVTVFGNNTAADAYCLRHSQSLSCDNPRALKPELPDESPQPGPTAVVSWGIVTANSTGTTGTVTSSWWSRL